MSKEPIPPHLNRLSGAVVNTALKVHRELGLGLLESVYESCLVYELAEIGIGVKTQVSLPIAYKK